MVEGVSTLLAGPARRMVHVFLPGPPSAFKEVHRASVCGIGRGSHTVGALREPSGSDKLSGLPGLCGKLFGGFPDLKWQSLG